MKSFYFGLALCFVVLTNANAAETEKVKDEKTLIMLEIEPITPDERTKRSSVSDNLRYVRQSGVPQEYLNFLQQLQHQQGAPQGEPQAPPQQQQQQHLIQQLVVSREGAKPPAAARYVLSQDGRLLEENFALGPNTQQFIANPYSPPRAPLPPRPPQPTGRPILSPELAEFSREQMRIQQDYHDAPIRAQIAGLTTRQPLGPAQPSPVGPASQAPQVFLSQQPSLSSQEARLRSQLQGQDPNLLYSQLQFDPQALLQQQLAQYAAAGGQPDGRPIPQLFTQAAAAPAPPPRPSGPQQVLFHQQSQPEVSQQKLIYQNPQAFQPRRPVQLAPSSQAQLLPENLPQQYLIETTKAGEPQAPQLPQIPQAPQFRYVQQPQAISQEQLEQSQGRLPPEFVSTLLQPAPGRGLFTPAVKPSRSSIFVSRASTQNQKPSVTVEEVVTEPPSPAKLPVVRIPSPIGQRPLTRGELEALVSAGYSVTPVGGPDPQQSNFLKAKRQQPILGEKRNHVVYQNHQDGVQYQYSPGSSSYDSAIRSRKSVKPAVEADKKSDDGRLVTYVVALGNESS